VSAVLVVIGFCVDVRFEEDDDDDDGNSTRTEPDEPVYDDVIPYRPETKGLLITLNAVSLITHFN